MTRVIVRQRTPGPVAGYTTVTADVEGGDSGDYLLADRIVGTQREVDEILAQSATRMELRLATKAGQE